MLAIMTITINDHNVNKNIYSDDIIPSIILHSHQLKYYQPGSIFIEQLDTVRYLAINPSKYKTYI